MHKLSATLKGHEQDVRIVVAINDQLVASGSRDGTVRIWKTHDDHHIWEGVILHKSEQFVNSLCYDETRQLLYCGGQNKLIISLSPFGGIDQESEFILVGHEGNICNLSCDKGLVMSSSWDKTARVWNKGISEYELKGHSASVWDIKMLPEDGFFLTASADKTIKLWHKEKVLQTFTNIHNDVVRQIAIHPDGDKFASCSNDTTIKVNDLEGNVLKTFSGHESFVYCVKFAPNGDIVSCGEDRSIRIWSPEGEVKQVIRIPAVSVWTIDILPNGDIIAGSSDNVVRIFTENNDRYATDEEQLQLQKDVEETAINSKTMDFDESKLSPYETLNQPGKEGQVVVVKSPVGVTEAHQFSQGQWSKVGDVVGSAANDQKIDFDGGKYDFVFDVDVQEGMPPLKLPFNATDNPYEAADQFLSRNDLPTEYREEVVRFIIKNTGITTFGETSKDEISDVRPMKVLPVKSYLEIKAFNPDAIFKGIVKVNSSEKTFDDEDLAAIGAGLHNINDNFELLFAQASIMRSSWSNKTAAYDILRLIVTKLPSADTISEFIEEGLDSSKPVLEMLTIRTLVNSFNITAWGTDLMSSSKVYESIFETIDVQYPGLQPKQTGNLAISIASLIFNYSVLVLHSQNLAIVPIIADTLNNKFGPSALCQDSEEASYRLLMAYGNISTVEPTLKQFAPSVSWIKHVRDRYSSIARFQDVLHDLSIL